MVAKTVKDGKVLTPAESQAMGNALMGSSVVNSTSRFTDGILASMDTWDEALHVFEVSGIGVESIEDYGTGFKLLNDKSRLVGVPLLVIEWRFTASKKYTNDAGEPTEFVSAMVITKHGDRYIVNDGSTGIAAQLRMVQDQRTGKGHPNPQAGLLVPEGLKRSEYTNEAGVPGVTYYLSE